MWCLWLLHSCSVVYHVVPRNNDRGTMVWHLWLLHAIPHCSQGTMVSLLHGWSMVAPWYTTLLPGCSVVSMWYLTWCLWLLCHYLGCSVVYHVIPSNYDGDQQHGVCGCFIDGEQWCGIHCCSMVNHVFPGKQWCHCSVVAP